MPAGYNKVRLGDGSEIGPMDLEAVRAWFVQGLLDHDSPVLKPGTKRWVTLDEVIDIKKIRRSAPRRVATAEADEGPAGPQLWRVRLAAALLFVGAGAAAYWSFIPERWLPALDGTPWRELALGQLALGLALVPGWEITRKLVRVAVVLVGFAAFPVVGMLLAQGVRGRPLLVPLLGWIAASGFFVLLGGGWLPPLRAALGVATVLGGWAGAGYFGLAADNAAEREVREWTAPERRFSDGALGVAFELPKGWIALRKEQKLVAVPPAALFVFAQPRAGGFGYLLVDPAPRDASSADEYLGRVLEERRRALPNLEERGRSDAVRGRLTGRAVATAWEAGGQRFEGLAEAWKNGRTYVALAAWLPSGGVTDAPRQLRSLRDSLSLDDAIAARLDGALQATAREVPFLSARGAEMIMGGSAAEVLDPEETFRRACKLASAGLAALAPTEIREMGDIAASAYATLPPKQRLRLAAYFEHVQARQPTKPEDDREMAGLMKRAVLQLSSVRLARLQALYEKAIGAAIARGERG